MVLWYEWVILALIFALNITWQTYLILKGKQYARKAREHLRLAREYDMKTRKALKVLARAINLLNFGAVNEANKLIKEYFSQEK